MALTRASVVILAVLAVSPAYAAATQSLASADAPGGYTANGPADDAQRAYASGRYEDARRGWAARAEHGDADAALGLGTLYDLGQGVARNPAAAFAWYRRAAEAGLSEAEFDVAVMRDAGIGTTQDEAKAALWYARAAAHGDPRAAFNLGQLYQAGDGVPRNPRAAAAWLRASDLPAARARLAGLAAATASDGELTAASVSAPGDGSTIAAAPGRAVELVWVAPAEPMPVRFFVQVVATPRDGTLREAFARDLDTTATLAPLSPGRYAWRVYSVAGDHYVASPWARFSVASAVSEQASAK